MQQLKTFLGVASLGACLFVSLSSFGNCRDQVGQDDQRQPRSPVETDEQVSPSGLDDMDTGVDYSGRNSAPQRTSSGSRGFDDFSGGSGGNSDIF